MGEKPPGSQPSILENEEGQTKNHLTSDLMVFVKTTTANLDKKFSNFRRFLIVVFLLIVVLLLGNFFHTLFKNVEKPPNENLIKYLEGLRQVYDSAAKSQHAIFIDYIKHTEDRERRDSNSLLQLQNHLVESINNFKPLYEKIPSYHDVSKDSLRRLLAVRFR